MNRRLEYYASCVNYPNLRELNHIIDKSREITYKTFRSHVDTDSFNEVKEMLGYTDEVRRNCNLTLQNDYTVGFFKSKTPRGETVYFISHSAIEYIFK